MSTLSSVPEWPKMGSKTEPKLEEILAAVYLAGIENGLGKTITDSSEIMHRKEAFIKTNPVCKEAVALINQQIKSVLDEIEQSKPDYSEMDSYNHSFLKAMYENTVDKAIQKIRSRYE